MFETLKAGIFKAFEKRLKETKKMLKKIEGISPQPEKSSLFFSVHGWFLWPQISLNELKSKIFGKACLRESWNVGKCESSLWLDKLIHTLHETEHR